MYFNVKDHLPRFLDSLSGGFIEFWNLTSSSYLLSLKYLTYFKNNLCLWICIYYAYLVVFCHDDNILIIQNNTDAFKMQGRRVLEFRNLVKILQKSGNISFTM